MITFSHLGKVGRMSNQLFQVAAVISTALKNNTSYILPEWEFEKSFNLHGCFSNNLPNLPVYREPHFHYSAIPAIKDLDLIGYFQSWRYIDPFKEEIIKLLTPIHNFTREDGLCSIHIRRGDYTTLQDHHPLMTMDYYNKAMQKSRCDKFIIMSDDIKWCKKNFKGSKFSFSETNDPTIDLALMAKKCSANIIANSSFSWWGAYLNQNPNKKVIAPSQWFGKSLSYHNTRDLLPTDWLI